MKRNFAATFAVFMLAMVVFFMLATLAHAQQNPGEGGVQHVICDSGCSGGSGGGTVDQGTGGMSAWKVNFGGTAQPITFGGTPQPVTFTMPPLVASSAVIGHVIVDGTVPVTMDITLQAVADAITGGAPVAKTLNDVVNQLATGVGITDGFAPVSIIHNPFSLYPGALATTLDPMLPLPAGTNLLGTVGIDQTTPGTTNAVRTQSGSTTVVTGNVTVVQPTGSNLHVAVDSAPTTAVTGPLTDTQLRATPVPVSGTVTTGGLTDTQLRATPVPVSGTVTANAGTNLNTSALALESGGNLASIKAKTDNIDVALSTRLKPADTLTAVTTVGTITNPVTVAQPTAANLNATVVGTGTFAAQVTGTVTANAGTNLNTSALALEAGNLASIKAKTDNLDVALSTRLKPADTLTAVTTVGTVSSVTAIANALPAGTNVIGHVITDTGSNTAVTGTVTVTGALTDTQLRATPVPVSGTVAVTSAGLTNLDVALSTRLKPADTLAAVTTVGTITNPVAVTNASLSNLDVALSTRTKPSDQQHAIIDSGVLTSITNTVAVTNAGLSNLDIALSALRDAIAGASPKTLADVYSLLSSVIAADGNVSPQTMLMVGGLDPNGNAQRFRTDADGAIYIRELTPVPGLGGKSNTLLWSCNALRRTNCR